MSAAGLRLRIAAGKSEGRGGESAGDARRLSGRGWDMGGRSCAQEERMCARKSDELVLGIARIFLAGGANFAQDLDRGGALETELGCS
eukprot:640248-Rhodomonas_salina.2